MVGKWFRRRLTRAMAVYAVVMSVGFMVAFPLVGAARAARGWRTAWAAIGAGARSSVLAPVAWLFDRSSPEAHRRSTSTAIAGRVRRGRQAATADAHPRARRCARRRSGSFALASSVYGLIASGIGLFNESILAERGFRARRLLPALAVTAITGLAGNFAAGAFADRGSLRQVLVAALVHPDAARWRRWRTSRPVGQVMAQAVAMGIAGGFVMVVFFSFWGRAYGPAHLGRIQGAAQAMTVLASAVGPLFLALWVETTGSYAAAFYALAAVVAALAVAAALVPIPAGAGGRGRQGVVAAMRQGQLVAPRPDATTGARTSPCAGVATAVAVLAGALLVGDSVRGSLRDLVAAAARRAPIVAVVSAGFFREQLAAICADAAFAQHSAASRR